MRGTPKDANGSHGDPRSPPNYELSDCPAVLTVHGSSYKTKTREQIAPGSGQRVVGQVKFVYRAILGVGSGPTVVDGASTDFPLFACAGRAGGGGSGRR